MIKLAVSIFICQCAGLLGSLFTRSSLPGWYAHINKPVFTPPNWVFAPVWALLYALMGTAAFLVWQKGLVTEGVKKALGIFILQLVLNVLWSVVFFGARSITGGLATIVFLWLAIAWTIKQFLSISKPAAVLLIPYIAWVSFALILNASLALLN